MNKKGKMLFLLLVLLTVICACGRQNDTSQKDTYRIYYENNDETGIFPQDYRTETKDKEALVSEFIEQLGVASGKLEYKAPLSGGFNLLDYSIAEDQVTLVFDENYKL